MRTLSHLLINSALAKNANSNGLPRSAFLFGAVIPDIPLGLLHIGYSLYSRFILEIPSPGLMPPGFDELYFTNPWWIASHNFLHSPSALLIYLVLLWRFRNKVNTVGQWLFWMVVGSSIHTIFDIFTHVDDGPLLFWPFDLQTRFHSPVSYYDPEHFGLAFTIFEWSLNVALLIYILRPWILKKIRKSNR
ncbi:MAG: metal-dependent hydrolase [Anaerolineaceae bacterium]